MSSPTYIPRRPPFRAEHIGSLLRPKPITNRRLQLDGLDALSIAQDMTLRQLEDVAIVNTVRLQRSLGYHAVTDGEYRRHQFWGTFFPGLEGFTEIRKPPMHIFRLYVPDLAAFTEAGHKPGESVVCTGKIRHIGSTYLREWNYLKELLPPEMVPKAKITLPAPEWYHLRYKTGYAYPADVYANDEEYFTDIATVYREELRILYEAGCRNVTIDDPNLAYFCDTRLTKGLRNDHTAPDPDALLSAYISLYNRILTPRPGGPDLHIGVHLCRGNFAYSRHFSSGGYGQVAPVLFTQLDVDTYYLEYDTPRAGDFSPLAWLPRDKNVVIGLVTSKCGQLEDLEQLKKRVLEAADWVGKQSGQTREEAPKRMGFSPQCGFASHHLGNSLTWEDMVEKLKLVRRLTDDIWPGEP